MSYILVQAFPSDRVAGPCSDLPLEELTNPESLTGAGSSAAAFQSPLVPRGQAACHLGLVLCLQTWKTKRGRFGSTAVTEGGEDVVLWRESNDSECEEVKGYRP